VSEVALSVSRSPPLRRASRNGLRSQRVAILPSTRRATGRLAARDGARLVATLSTWVMPRTCGTRARRRCVAGERTPLRAAECRLPEHLDALPEGASADARLRSSRAGRWCPRLARSGQS
jgi:hypothetical protein